jgi:hypothetical protein
LEDGAPARSVLVQDLAQRHPPLGQFGLEARPIFLDAARLLLALLDHELHQLFRKPAATTTAHDVFLRTYEREQANKTGCRKPFILTLF